LERARVQLGKEGPDVGGNSYRAGEEKAPHEWGKEGEGGLPRYGGALLNKISSLQSRQEVLLKEKGGEKIFSPSSGKKGRLELHINGASCHKKKTAQK